MNKVLVTGAAGYIGRHVVKQLLDMGAEVIACDLRLNNVDDRAIKISEDIFSGRNDIFEQLGSPDVCLHLAWRDGFIHNSDAHMEYLSNHYTFIKNMADAGLKQIAIMGSMHEVGYYEGAVNENTPCNPLSMYGIAKDALRRSTLLMLKDKDIVVQWLRAYYIYGDDKYNSSIFAKLIQAEENGMEYFPFTTGKNKYDFIQVDELAKLLSLSIMQNKVNGIINCCTGKPVSLAEKVEEFIKKYNLKIKLKYGAFPDRDYDSPAIWGDSTKIELIKKEASI